MPYLKPPNNKHMSTKFNFDQISLLIVTLVQTVRNAYDYYFIE